MASSYVYLCDISVDFLHVIILNNFLSYWENTLLELTDTMLTKQKILESVILSKESTHHSMPAMGVVIKICLNNKTLFNSYNVIKCVSNLQLISKTGYMA